MKRLKFYVSTNKVGSKVEEIVELEDDMTDQEIEEYFKEWVWNNIDVLLVELRS